MATETRTTRGPAGRPGAADAAYLYCDYWAAVLGLRGVVRESVVRDGRVDPALFRALLDRPETRSPRFLSHLLTVLAGPVLIPYRVLQHARSRLHLHLSGDDEAEELLAGCRLAVEPDPQAPGGGVRIRHGEQILRGGLFDPRRAEVVFSLVYPTYKLLFSAFIAIVLTLLAQWALGSGNAPESLGTVVRFAHYPLVVLLSWLVFRDGITAFAAPLPVYVFVGVLRVAGEWTSPRPELFGAGLVAIAAAYFLADVFLVPKGMAPTLFYYSADPEDPAHSYASGQAPEWLAGRSYWVWRFVYSTAAELNKVWERDWERVEAWVHAEGERAGELEWIVVDFHYRELWIPKRRLVRRRRSDRHRVRVSELRQDGRSFVWLVETDMNVVFHSPAVRSIHLMPLEHGWRAARLRQLFSSLRMEERRDHPHRYRAGVRRLRAVGHDVVADIPEHFRGYALRQLMRTPWRYWRYARGANTAARPFLYSQTDAPGSLPATEHELQLKAEREDEDE